MIGKLSALVPMLWVMTLPDTQRLPHVCAWSLSHVWLSVTPWTIAHQAPLSMGFSRQECWSGLPFPALGDLTDPGIEPASLVSPTLAGRFLTTCGNLETHMSSMGFLYVSFKLSLLEMSIFCHNAPLWIYFCLSLSLFSHSFFLFLW